MKANLKQKVLCSLLAASAFGFAYSDSVYAASLNGNEINKVVTNDTLSANDSAKFVIGQGDIVIQTNGSVGKLMADYNKYIKEGKSQLDALRLALGNPKENGIVVGVVGGEGRIDAGTLSLLNSKTAGLVDGKLNHALDKLSKIDTAGNNKLDGDISVTIGGENSEPVVIGFTGGDLAVNTGASGSYKFNVLIIKDDVTLNKAETVLERKGNIITNIESGNVFGGAGSSTALALGNIQVKSGKGSGSRYFEGTDITFDGKTTTKLDGNVTTNVANGANVAGFANGGAALGVGGTADSTVTGNTVFNITSNIDGKALEGLTVGVAGAGVAVSTIGGTANSVVEGSSTVNVTDGLVAGVIGGGIATSIDAAGLLNKGNDNGVSDFGIDIQLKGPSIEIVNDASKGDLSVYIGSEEAGKGVIDGGTATSTVKGETHVKLLGNTSAAGVIGGGIAMSSHTYTNRDNTDGSIENNGQPGGNSVAKAETGKTNVYINLNKSELDKGKVVNAAKELKNNLGNIDKLDSAKLIAALQKSSEDLKGQGAAMGVLGGGVAVAHGDANSSATADNAGSQIELANGYIAGVFGGGAALATNNAKATVNATDAVEMDIYKDAEVVGIFGNGIAYFTGSSDSGTKDLSGLAAVNAGDTTINIAGSADGVVGGGLAIDDSMSDKTNASVKTNGTSTINVLDGAKVDKMNFQPLESLAGKANQDLIDMGNYVAGVKEAAGNVAIAGGGVAVGGGAESYVKESVINVAGGTVTGDVIGGGVAAYGYAKDGAPVGGTTVDKSTMNLTGGKIDGSVYAGGAISKMTTGGSGYDQAKSTVKEAVINLAGTEVTGEISGQGYKHIDGDNNTVGSSVLNVMGENTLTALTDKSKINGFNNVNFKAGSVTTVDGLNAGNEKALIDGNEKTITVENGAKLDISKLAKVDEEGKTYFVATNYDKDSALWDNSDLAYDRTDGYAFGKDAEGKYNVTYKHLDQLTEEEQQNAINDFVDSLGSNGKNLRGIVEGILTYGEHGNDTNEGALEFFKDFTSSVDAADPDLTAALMLGEASGVTSNAVSIAGDMADNAVLRLSFTQDKVTGETTVAEDGGVWAKYIHNKHDVDDMASSMGGLTSTSKYDGIMVGAEFAKKGKVQSGVAFTYGDGDAHGMGTKNDFDMWGINVYGNVKNDDSNVIADIGFAKNTNDITGSALGKDLSADRDLNILTMGVRAEKLYTNGNTQVVPYAGLRYMSVDADSYTTYYNGKAAFENDADRQNIWTLPIGVSLRNETVTKSGWRFTPRADLSYIWAFGDTDNDMTVNAGSGYDTLSYTVMDSGSWLGALALEAAKDDWSYGVGYSYQKGSHAENNKWFVNVNYSF